MPELASELEPSERLDEDWQVVQDLLPRGWELKARELGALRRGRGIADAATLLRVMLIHLAQGCGLRETAVRAHEGGLASVSDVAILKRLKGCGEWFNWMAEGLRQRWLPEFPAAASAWAGRRVRLVDGTMVSEPGDTGSQWRLHYSIGVPALNCDEVVITSPREGETLKRYSVAAGDILIGDRGYAHPAGIAHVVAHQGDVIIRTNLVTLPLHDAQGVRLDPLEHLRTLRVGQCGQWPVWVRNDKRSMDKGLIAGRLCAVKKSAAAAQKARQRVLRESRRGGTQVRPETLEAADYVFVFTTLNKAFKPQVVMELYRGRWQIELAFKRLKSLVQLGHLKKHDALAARAWLQGKLLVAFILDALLETAERISPWGYQHWQEAPQSLPLARDVVHA
jgi:Transposase DDE domain